MRTQLRQGPDGIWGMFPVPDDTVQIEEKKDEIVPESEDIQTHFTEHRKPGRPRKVI